MNSIKNLIMNIVIIVLAIVMVISLYFAITEFYDVFHMYQNSENSFMYTMEDGNYARLVEMYHDNVGTDGKEKESFRECYGVAKYYESAFFYEMYRETGDTVRAENYKETMDAAEAQLGELTFLKEDIDTKLGVE